MEEKVRDRGQRILELEVMLSRVRQENIMLEERNKALVEHLQRSTPSPSPSEHMLSPSLQVGQWCSIRVEPVHPCTMLTP